MKLLILWITFISGTAMASGYEPFKFRCVYDATSDGLITATSKIDPDNDDWTFLLKSSLQSETETHEATSAYIYGKDENTEPNTTRIIKALAKKLRIEPAQWYTTTEITIWGGEPAEMKFFKFNSQNGTLGIGIYADYLGQDILTECK